MRRNARAALLSLGTAIALLLPIAAAAAGPPYPDPVDGQAVYDNAGILSDAAIANAEATIDAIEARTAAEIVVYTELADYGVTTEETETRARALIDQWGVGRRGFDDGLAIFFDIDPSLEHGQVQLYAAPGFEATFLTNAERQAIFDDDMVPYLRNADFDGALGVALEKDRRRRDAGERRTSRNRPADQCRARADRRPDRVHGPGRLGVHAVAPVRQGPGLPRRPLDPHAGAAAGPDRGLGGVRHGRRHVAARADDRDARSRVARPDLVPGGSRAARAVEQGRHRGGTADTRPGRGGAARAQRPATDRAGGGVRPEGAP